VGLAEIHAAEPHRVADRAVIAGQFGPGVHVFCGNVVPKRDPERTRVRLVGMIEVPPVVAAQHPQAETGVKRRIGLQETLQLRRHLGDFLVREHAVDAAVEAQISCPARTGSLRKTPMPWIGLSLSSVSTINIRAPRRFSPGATKRGAKGAIPGCRFRN
jgi:hypothetical protein